MESARVARAVVGRRQRSSSEPTWALSFSVCASDEKPTFAAAAVTMLVIERSSARRVTRARIPAASVAMWLCATCLVAATPLLYFAAGASDSATEAARIGYASLPLLVAWLPLALSLGVICRRQSGRLGLPFGPPGRRAALLIALTAIMLAGVRTVGMHSTIYGDTAWALLWLGCFVAWVTLGWTAARRPTAR